MNEPEEYMLRWRGREFGPFPLSEINRQLDEHEIGKGHEILCQERWITLEEFLAALNPPPAPPPPARAKSPPIRVKLPVASEPEAASTAPVVAAQIAKPRYRLLFAFLAIVAGFLGMHNFYARQWLTGLLQLLLSVATYLMGFGIIASWLWAMTEAVIVRRDGDGIEMI